MSKNRNSQNKFIKKFQILLDEQYRIALSENIKRGVAEAKKRKNEAYNN